MDTIFEIEDIDNTPETPSEKPVKKEPKIKKKKEMSEERKQKLRDQLSKGRKTLADKRAKIKSERVEPEPVKKVEKVKKENMKIEIKSNDNDYLKNEISELKKLILEGRTQKEEIKKEVPKKEVIKVVKEEIKPIPKVESVPIPIPIQKKKRSLLGGGMVLNLKGF
jgi:predicted  nucleic acid-binding Zn-ribbon protein